jgi:6-hydroxytryprostatin B O-methyltransferase
MITKYRSAMDSGKSTCCAHNSVSAVSVRNPGLADWALFVTQFSMPVAGSFADATKRWGSTKRKDQTAFNLALKTDLPLFDFIQQSPEITCQFAAYMQNVQQSDGMSVRHLVNSYDWAALGDATVIDVSDSSPNCSKLRS